MNENPQNKPRTSRRDSAMKKYGGLIVVVLILWTLFRIMGFITDQQTPPKIAYLDVFIGPDTDDSCKVTTNFGFVAPHPSTSEGLNRAQLTFSRIMVENGCPKAELIDSTWQFDGTKGKLVARYRCLEGQCRSSETTLDRQLTDDSYDPFGF